MSMDYLTPESDEVKQAFVRLGQIERALCRAAENYVPPIRPSIHRNPGREKALNIAYRFRIYPTEEQKILLGKTFGCCRFTSFTDSRFRTGRR